MQTVAVTAEHLCLWEKPSLVPVKWPRGVKLHFCSDNKQALGQASGQEQHRDVLKSTDAVGDDTAQDWVPYLNKPVIQSGRLPTANGYSCTTPPEEGFPGYKAPSFDDVTCSGMFVEMMEYADCRFCGGSFTHYLFQENFYHHGVNHRNVIWQNKRVNHGHL